MLFGILATSFIATNAFAYTKINSQLDPGERNADVTSLQQYLRDSPSLYPSGLVTGYYGNLTTSAVTKFQATHGLSQVGRVGPLTRDKINSLIDTASGGVTPVETSSLTAPLIYNVSSNVTQTSATFSWTTNENANARIFYDIAPVQFNEGQIDSSGFGARTGQIASTDSNLRTTHSVSFNGLMPNTTYYYTLVSTDASGNVSVFGPNMTFRTSN